MSTDITNLSSQGMLHVLLEPLNSSMPQALTPRGALSDESLAELLLGGCFDQRVALTAADLLPLSPFATVPPPSTPSRGVALLAEALDLGGLHCMLCRPPVLSSWCCSHGIGG